MMENSVGNIFDYIAWRGDLTFAQSEFNAVDGLILCIFSYFKFVGHEDFRGKTLRYAVSALKDVPFKEKIMIICMVQEQTSKFIDATVESKRFRDLEILDYVDEYSEEDTQQFAAVTFKLPDGSVFVSYRGTDDSLVGWKEDCNMAFINGVPSQISAAEYAQSICDKYKCPVRIGGQSKGGNLAIWAGANLKSETKSSLLQIFNYDGPGFLDEFLESDGYKDVQDKILAFVPEASIVGILMGHCDYLVTKSSSHLIFQHDPFSWNVVGKRFEYAADRSNEGKKMDAMINKFISDMNSEEKAELVEKIFEVMSETKAKTLDELKAQKLRLVKYIPKLIGVSVDLKKKRAAE